MDLQVLAQNVRRIRNAKRFSQRALAESAGLSASAIKNLEGARNEPRMNSLQAIAQALDVRLKELFLPVRKLKTVRFRSSKRMQNRENILADISRWLDDFNYLEDTLGERVPFSLEDIRDQCSRDETTASASSCRRRLGLKATQPIHDICGLLEHAGVKIYPISCASDGFFGLSIGKEDDGPAIVVNVWVRISVERRIFSAVHELGHLMLHADAYDVSQTEENKEEEKEADLFAGHFLMPDAGFRKVWNGASGLHWVDRVLKVKQVFHVSYKTVLFRLIENDVADQFIWRKFNVAYKNRFNHKLSFREEPMAIRPLDFSEDRFSRLLRRALEEEKVSLSRGAEILGIGIEEMQDLLDNWEVVL